MRWLARLSAVVILVPVLYVASAAVYFPAVVWHRFVPPRSSELMEIRARAAGVEGRPFELRYEWVPLERISPHLVHGVLAAEDTRFYEHHGFDLEQIRQAWEIHRRGDGRPLRGASTITQQTAKNLYLSPSRNALRKAREAILTGWIELWLPKERILELYLNLIELGPGLFGAQAASSAYFDRPAVALSRDQAALLAATLPAPLARNPARPTRALERRQRMIVNRMGRWYEGPSLAAEEAVRDEKGAERPVEISAEPLDVEPMLEESAAETTAPAPDDAPRDEAEPAGAEPEEVLDSVATPPSTTPAVGDTAGGG
jgi:monofunctional biosynthetic peptidoglycan transglycosylase